MGRHSYANDKKTGSLGQEPASEIALESTRPVRAQSSGDRVDAVVRARKRHRLRNAFLIFAGVVVVLLAALCVWALLFVNSVNSDLAHGDPKAIKALTQTPASNKSNSAPPQPFTILLLGTDNRGQAGDSRSDTILLARIDPGTKQVWLLSLPRDTRVDIPGYGVAKLSKAYPLGGAALTIDTVEQLLGVPVNHYMEVNINGFKRIVEVLGGVWIDVDQEINDPKAAAANPGHEGQHIMPGYQKLSPAQALVFVRSRDFTDADFTRMRHQQEFFKAVAKQSMTIGNIFRIPRLVREVSGFTRTDLTVGQLVGIARRLRGVGQDGLYTATLAGEWRSPFVYLDESVKQDLVARMMGGRTFDESSTASVATVPADVSVAVRNGSGIAGAATKAASALTASGFDVRETGNAKRSDYAKTLVVYQNNATDADAVVNEIGQGEIIEGGSSYDFDTDVLVVVGRDWHAVTPRKTATQ